LLQQRPAPAQRHLFDDLVLKAAIAREWDWVKDLVLQHSVITHRLVVRLMKENKHSDLIFLCIKADRP
jgi:hypothetical protein